MPWTKGDSEEDRWLLEMIRKERKRKIQADRALKEPELRKKYPALQDAYEKYQTILSLVQEQDEKNN